MGKGNKVDKAFNIASTKIGHGEQARTATERYASALCAALGLPETALVRGPMKRPERILEKANGRFNGAIEKVGDITRCRILFNDPAQIVALRRLLQSNARFKETWEDHGITLKEIDDSFLNPKDHGHIGFDLKAAVDLGKGRKAISEIQFMHEHMQITDFVTHVAYEEMRTIRDRAQTENRSLTFNEETSVKGYARVIKTLYEADSWNYGLVKLRQNPPPEKGRVLHGAEILAQEPSAATPTQSQ